MNISLENLLMIRSHAGFYTNRTKNTDSMPNQPRKISTIQHGFGRNAHLISASHQAVGRRAPKYRPLRTGDQPPHIRNRPHDPLHGVEDFHIERGDTLGDPSLSSGVTKQFDLVLANPPYSIKQWDRAKWASDKWGRNMYGTPPQAMPTMRSSTHHCEHETKTRRSAILYPHGILFRDQEKNMREKISADLVECVIGLGPNLLQYR